LGADGPPSPLRFESSQWVQNPSDNKWFTNHDSGVAWGSMSVTLLGTSDPDDRLKVFHPLVFNDAVEFSMAFRAERIVVVVMPFDEVERRRIVDFATGLALGTNAVMKRFDPLTYILIPSGQREPSNRSVERALESARYERSDPAE
jgi:FtsZ-interacting cell division protein YlmF